MDGENDKSSGNMGAPFPPTEAPSHLATRVASALVLIPLALSAVWLGGVWYAILLVIAGVLMSAEWGMILGLGRRTFWLFMGLSLLIGTGFILLRSGGDITFWIISCAAIGVMLLLLGKFKGVSVLRWLGLAVLYCWTPVYALFWLRDAEQGLWLVAWVLLVVWGTDIGGYFVGRSVGGAKLVPQISPNKTWSGLFGGMLLAAIAGATGAIWFNLGNAILLALAGATLAVVAQTGDIAESALKRHFGVKDSSRLIPGHGGLLDRVDGLVFVAPVVAMVVAFSGWLEQQGVF